MEKHEQTVAARAGRGEVYEAHQYALSVARRLRKKDGAGALWLLGRAVAILGQHEDTLEIGKYALVMGREMPELQSAVTRFCVQATLDWPCQQDWLLEWDKVCIQHNNQHGCSEAIPSAFACKYAAIGLVEQAIPHAAMAPLPVLQMIMETGLQQASHHRQPRVIRLVPLLLGLLGVGRTGAVLTLSDWLLAKTPCETEVVEIIRAMALAHQAHLDKRTWIRLRMLLEQRIGVSQGSTRGGPKGGPKGGPPSTTANSTGSTANSTANNTGSTVNGTANSTGSTINGTVRGMSSSLASETKQQLDSIAHTLFQMPMQKQMTMADMMKAMLGGGQ